jgi:uncharacterized oxidoreductase
MVVVPSRFLTDRVRQIFLGAGSELAEATAIAENLVMANLMGHDSHGVQLILRYVTTALGDRLVVNGHAEVVSDNGVFALIDGGMAYGQVAGREAMEFGIAKARSGGASVVGLRNVHHLGRIGAWGEICAAAGLISIHYVNAAGHPPLVAPFGGSDARFGTNPYCTAFPATNGPPIVLDMATSHVAMGKVVVAHNKGVRAPAEALIDAQGNPSDDPAVMFTDPPGALRPMGLHKGYGLALICELMAGALVTGAGAAKPELFGQDTIRNNMLSILIEPSGLGQDEGFAAEIDNFTDWVKASPPAPGVDEVMVPGDPERKSRATRERDGIPLDDETWRQVIEAGVMVGMSPSDFDGAAG